MWPPETMVTRSSEMVAISNIGAAMSVLPLSGGAEEREKHAFNHLVHNRFIEHARDAAISQTTRTGGLLSW